LFVCDHSQNDWTHQCGIIGDGKDRAQNAKLSVRIGIVKVLDKAPQRGLRN
jgi:hypothetical protein